MPEERQVEHIPQIESCPRCSRERRQQSREMDGARDPEEVGQRGRFRVVQGGEHVVAGGYALGGHDFCRTAIFGIVRLQVRGLRPKRDRPAAVQNWEATGSCKSLEQKRIGRKHEFKHGLYDSRILRNSCNKEPALSPGTALHDSSTRM